MVDLERLEKGELLRLLQENQQALAADADESKRLLHDLQVHRIELEMQNRELRDAQQALEVSRDRYADLYDFAPVGYLSLDCDGNIREANLTAAALLGVNRRRLTGWSLNRFVLPADRDSLFFCLRKAFRQTGVSQAAELRIDTDEGVRRQLRLEARAMAAETGDAECRVVMLDLTEQTRIESALAKREIQYRTVLETTADGFWMVDTQGRILEANDAYVRRSGYSRGELLGMSIGDLDVNESPLAIRQRIEKIKREGSDRFETRHRTRGGETWPVEVSTSYLVDTQGLFFAFLRDITERKILEREIIDTSTAEQTRIGREIHDHLGQQLTGTAMLAASLARRLSAAGRAGEAEAAGQLREHLQTALEHARALARGLSPIELDPEELPQALSSLVAGAGEMAGIPCRLLSAGPVETRCHTGVATHLYRIAQEALNNAVKHARAGHIEVRLRSTDQRISLSVSDDGIGIEPMTDRKGRLGLQIMRYRADICGGSLTVRRRAEGGTLVECSVPVGCPPEDFE